MKTIVISATTFIVLSFLQHVFLDSDMLQTLSDEDAAIRANNFLDTWCDATTQRVVTFPNYQRVPDYSVVYDCSAYFVENYLGE